MCAPAWCVADGDVATQHVYVCNCIRVFEDMANLYILLEYCPNRVRPTVSFLPNQSARWLPSA